MAKQKQIAPAFPPTFNLEIASSTSPHVLRFNAGMGKWECWLDGKMLARRKNVGMLVQAVVNPAADKALEAAVRDE